MSKRRSEPQNRATRIKISIRCLLFILMPVVFALLDSGGASAQLEIDGMKVSLRPIWEDREKGGSSWYCYRSTHEVVPGGWLANGALVICSSRAYPQLWRFRCKDRKANEFEILAANTKWEWTTVSGELQERFEYAILAGGDEWQYAIFPVVAFQECLRGEFPI